MGLSIKYTLEDFDKNKIIDKYGMQENGDTQLFLANTCFRRMQKYVPFDTGALSTTVTVRPGSVTYEQPYAHAQYIGEVHGSPVRNYTTPGTGSYWDKKMVSAEMNDVIKEVQDYVNRGK